MRHARFGFVPSALKSNEAGGGSSSILVDFFAKYGWLEQMHPGSLRS